MRLLPISAYAESEVTVSTAELPVFVTVLQSQTPAIADFVPWVELITSVFAAAVGRSRERAHVEYAPPGAGRHAFGGQLV